MNKFKKILLGALSILTLGLVAVTGARVNVTAATSYIKDDNYSWRLTSSSETLSTSGTFTFTRNSESYGSFDSALTINGESFTYYASSKARTCTINLSDTVWTDNDVTAYVYLYATGNVKYTIGSGSQSDNITKNEMVLASGDLTKANNKIVLSSNNGRWCGIDLVLTPTKSNDDFINEAKEAIDEIPSTTADLEAYKTALDAAKDAIDACENGINDLPEAYQTKYNNAVSTYNDAFANVAVDLAKEAIDEIPSTTADLEAYKTALDAAKDAIDACQNGINDLPEAYQTKYNNALDAYDEAYNNAQVEANNARFGQTDSFTANDFTGEGLDITTNGEQQFYNITTETQLGSSIFFVNNCQKQLKDSSGVSTAATILGTAYDGRFKTSSKTAIKFTTTSAGAISFVVLSGSSSSADRKVHLYNSDASDSLGWVYAPTSVATAEIQTINVPSAGTYYLGTDSKGVNIFGATFTASSTKALSQTYTDSDYTYIRFVTIVKGEAELTNSKFNFGVTMTYTDSSTKTVDYTNNEKLYVVKKITSSGENYVGNVNSQSYEFANHAAEYYVVFILRLTTSTFAGCSVCSNFTYNGLTLHSSSETI